MEENTVLSLLESISGNNSLRKKFLEALQGASQEEIQDPASPPVVSDHSPPTSGEGQLAAHAHQLGNDSSLGAHVPQSRGVGLGASVHHSSDNPLGEGGSQYNEEEASLTSEDDFTFVTHQVIVDYLEKHFRASLHKDARNAMHKAHPIARTPAMRVPKVDGFVQDHLKQRFPKSRDHEPGAIQSALLRCTGPLTCLWSELIDNELLKSEDAVINVQDVMNVLQRTLVLLGNTNELISQARRCSILRACDQDLEKYGKEPPNNNKEFLFGKEFCSQLKSQVESDKTLTQVVQMSHCYKPYDPKARQSTLGHSKKQFFRQSPAGNTGPDRAMLLSLSSKARLPSPASSHSNHGTSNNPVPKAPLTRGDRENPERLTFATPLASSTQFEYGSTRPAHMHTSGRKDLPIF